jgi:hypothetical protein
MQTGIKPIKFNLVIPYRGPYKLAPESPGNDYVPVRLEVYHDQSKEQDKLAYFPKVVLFFPEDQEKTLTKFLKDNGVRTDGFIDYGWDDQTGKAKKAIVLSGNATATGIQKNLSHALYVLYSNQENKDPSSERKFRKMGKNLVDEQESGWISKITHFFKTYILRRPIQVETPQPAADNSTQRTFNKAGIISFLKDFHDAQIGFYQNRIAKAKEAKAMAKPAKTAGRTETAQKEKPQNEKKDSAAVSHYWAAWRVQESQIEARQQARKATPIAIDIPRPKKNQ